jgi:hypothetical protein
LLLQLKPFVYLNPGAERVTKKNPASRRGPGIRRFTTTFGASALAILLAALLTTRILLLIGLALLLLSGLVLSAALLLLAGFLLTGVALVLLAFVWRLRIA